MGGSWIGVLKATVVLTVAGFLWVLASLEMGDPDKKPNPDTLVMSDRKRESGDRTAVRSGGSRVEREPRNLEELQREFERFCRECEKENNAFFQIPDLTNPPPGVKAWLEGFTDQEIVLLSKSLFQQQLDQTEGIIITKKSLLGVLVAAWGKDDPRRALAYEGSFKDDYSLSIKYPFRAWVYAGWASEDPKAAWAHFSPAIFASDSGGAPDQFSNNPWVYHTIVATILGKLARESPEMVWDLLNEQGLELGFDPRVWTSVFKALPNESDWEEIARDFEKIGFGPSESAIDLILSGNAEASLAIFTRWANESPADALPWFEANAEGLNSPGRERLVADWYDQFPGQAASWIDEKLREGNQEFEAISWEMAERKGLSFDTLRWAQNHPNAQTRFEIFKAASMSKDPTDPLTFFDPEPNYRLRGDSFDIEFLEQQLPAFGLTKEQETEIREILRKRNEGTQPASADPFGE